MKNYLSTLSAIVFGLFIGFTSCSSDDDKGPGTNSSAGTISAKIDGNSFQSQPLLSRATQVEAGAATALILQGTDNSGKGFNLNITGFTGTGTYEIGGANSIFVIASYVEGNPTNPLATQTWTAPYDNENLRGTISFSEATATNVKGTFAFTAKNPNDDSVINVTEGAFNLDITQ
jgi:hypothetical protein